MQCYFLGEPVDSLLTLERMPLCLDVYVMTRERTQVTLDRFLDSYVDRAASEDRGDEELMMLPLGASAADLPLEDWEWEPARTLSQVIERGLGRPARAFAVYLTPRTSAFERAIMAFTTDGQVVLGLSLTAEGSERLSEAKSLLKELATGFSAHRGFVAVEVPPPLFGAIPARHDRLLHSWEQDTVEQ